jgi:hypothetical protein
MPVLPAPDDVIDVTPPDDEPLSSSKKHPDFLVHAERTVGIELSELYLDRKRAPASTLVGLIVPQQSRSAGMFSFSLNKSALSITCATLRAVLF